MAPTMRHLHKGDRWGASCVPQFCTGINPTCAPAACSQKEMGHRRTWAGGGSSLWFRDHLGHKSSPKPERRGKQIQCPFVSQHSKTPSRCRSCRKNMGVVLRVGTVPKRYTLHSNPVIARCGCWEPGKGPKGLLQRRADREVPATARCRRCWD